MLIPQFTLRWLLGLMAVCAGIFSIFGLAVAGKGWAAALSIAILGLVAAVILYALLYLMVWPCSLAIGAAARKAASGRAPFAPAAEQLGASAREDDDDQPADAIVRH